MKKLIMFLLMAMLLTASAGAVDLYVDMEKIETDTPPTIVDGRTMVPLRAIFEAIGANVEWDNNTRTATGTRDNTTVVIQIDNPTAYVNSEARTLDVPAQLINDRTMVPARFISEAMGCDVTWYDTTKTAAVANTLKGQHFYVTATGDHYHYSDTCNGGTYYEATLAEAVGRGLTACDKCVLTVNKPGSSTAPTAKHTVDVLRVIEGDTIVVDYNGTEEIVRLIGVETPKNSHSATVPNRDAGFAAYEFTATHLLAATQVELEFDTQQRNQEGQLLAYVYYDDGTMLNKKLLSIGHATLSDSAMNAKYATEFASIVSNRDSSIPTGDYYDGYMKAPALLYRTTGAENGLTDAFLYDDGIVKEFKRFSEYNYFVFETKSGRIAIVDLSTKSDFSSLKVGDSAKIGFVYFGHSTALNMPNGAYLETLELSDTQSDRDPGWNQGSTQIPDSSNSATQPPVPVEPQSRKVYVTKTGKRYHYSSTCNGGTYYESTLDDAKRRGLTPCDKCVN